MSDQYIRDLLRVAVAQICQTIGYNSTQANSLDLLQDVLHKFMHEFSRDLRRQVEHANRTEVILNDACLSLETLNVNVSELVDYINHVEPVSCVIEVPKFPVHKDTHLNFLKPGSREVLIRPMHIYEYLPPMKPLESLESSVSSLQIDKESIDVSQFLLGHKLSTDLQSRLKPACCTSTESKETEKKETNMTNATTPYKSKITIPNHSITDYIKDDEGRPTREIISVVMTTGGFISPAIEGKLPDAIIPDVIGKFQGLDAPPLTLTNISTSSNALNNIEDRKVASNAFIKISGTTTSCVSKTQLNSDVGISKSVKKNVEPLDIFDVSIYGEHNSNRKKLNNFANTINQTSAAVATKLLKRAKKSTLNTQNYQMNTLNEHNDKNDSDIMLASMTFSDLKEKSNSKRFNKIQQKFKKSKSDKLQKIEKEMDMNKRCNKYVLKLLKKQAKQINLNKSYKTLFSGEISAVNERKKVKLLKNNSDAKIKKYFSKEALSNTFVMSNSAEEMCSSKVSLNLSPLPKIEGKLVDTQPSNKLICEIEPESSLYHLPIKCNGNNNNKDDGRSGLQNYSEIKLPSEPDRTKLNIFKKISKPKLNVSKITSPKSNTNILPGAFYGNNNNQVSVNLPSGTTITPTPLATLSPVINELQKSEILPTTKNNTLKSCFPKSKRDNISTSLENVFLSQQVKSRKRGRKPGSKNSKTATFGETFKEKDLFLIKDDDNISNKRIESLELQKQIVIEKYRQMSVNTKHVDQITNEPLNVDNTNFQLFREQTNYIDTNFCKIIESLDKEIRRERKKNKNKGVSQKSSTNIPTEEEVNSINKKLMRMDTVLKPAPSSISILNASVPDFITTTSYQADEIALESSLKNSNLKNRQKQQNLNDLDLSSTNALGNFSNVMSMLSMYPFSSRPGLIPTPNVFPTHTSLGNFSNNSPNVTASAAAGMLLPSFLSFPNIKSTACTTSSNSQDNDNNVREQNNSASSINIPSSQKMDGGIYCNVAPLVPESMKLAPVKKIEQSHNDRFNISKTPKLYRKASGPGNSDDKNININIDNKLISQTSDMLLKESSTANFNVNESKVPSISNLHPLLNYNEPIELSDDSMDGLATSSKEFVSHTSSFIKKQSVESNKLKSNYDLPSNMSTLNTNIDKTIIHATDTESVLSKMLIEVKKNKKILKPTKYRHSTLFTNLPNPNAESVDIFGGDNNKNSGGVGKLAGGADLIPLRNTTGFAYSSKTIPTNSLTASTANNTSQVHGGTVNIPVIGTYSNQNSSTGRITHPMLVSDNLSITPASIDKTNVSAASTLICSNEFVSSLQTQLMQQKKHKEHKKIKRIKDGKVKKRKDKKDKTKNKNKKLLQENIENFEDKIGKDKDLEKRKLQSHHHSRHKDKDFIRKLKKEKKKEKQRYSLDIFERLVEINNPNNSDVKVNNSEAMNVGKISTIIHKSNSKVVDGEDNTSSTPVPKITLKLGSANNDVGGDKTLQGLVSSAAHINVTNTSSMVMTDERDPSPELARISPLVTRPPKSKFSVISGCNNIEIIPNNKKMSICSGINTPDRNSAQNLSNPGLITPSPPTAWLSGGTLTASSVLLPQQLLQISNCRNYDQQQQSSTNDKPNTLTSATLISEANRPSSYIDADGNRVWICPACGKVDDGSPMIGCDGCDAWYHWICVGIFVAPKDNEDWYCRVCITRKKGIHSGDKKRKRNKKK